jgi:G3E family GTPase
MMNFSMLKPNQISVPTTIFSGFLGSGKTTLISHLVDALQQRGEQVVYIKNEIGDEDIDGQIMRGKNIKTKELLNGCICCTLVGPFASAIDEVISSYQPDRVLIEASGAADPAALALMVSSHPSLYRDGVIGIIDVVNFKGYEDLSITSKNQTKFIDLLIFNKIELVDLDRKRAVVGYVRELNAHSPIVEAPKGRIAPEVVFGANSKELSALLQEYQKTQPDPRQSSDDDHPHHHIEQDGIESFKVILPGLLNRQAFDSVLEKLPPALFRAKGIVRFEDGSAYLFNKVGKRTDYQPLPQLTEVAENRLVFIGYQVNEMEKNIAKQFEECIIESGAKLAIG